MNPTMANRLGMVCRTATRFSRERNCFVILISGSIGLVFDFSNPIALR